MASWVFCNRCFQPPSRSARFSLTSCGHVYCDGCLSRGKKDECLICKVPCRTVLLSKHTDSGIQALFMGIDRLCRKYSKETSQISEFQERHRRRLAAFHREKIARLEECLRKSALRVEQLQSTRPSQHPAFSRTRNPGSTPSATPGAPLLLPAGSAVAERAEPMEVDLTPTPLRRPELAAGPARISLISPPQDGRMGSVLCPGPPQLSLTPGRPSVSPAFRIPPLQTPCPGSSQSLGAQAPRQSGRRGLVRSGQPPRPPAPRPPISISGLLQRRQSGSAGPGGLALGR